MGDIFWGYIYPAMAVTVPISPQDGFTPNDPWVHDMLVFLVMFLFSEFHVKVYWNTSYLIFRSHSGSKKTSGSTTFCYYMEFLHVFEESCCICAQLHRKLPIAGRKWKALQTATWKHVPMLLDICQGCAPQLDTKISASWRVHDSHDPHDSRIPTLGCSGQPTRWPHSLFDNV